MAVVAKYTCDGCGIIEEKKIGRQPDCWQTVTLALNGIPHYVESVFGREYELCRDCQVRLGQWFNDQAWRPAVPHVEGIYHD